MTGFDIWNELGNIYFKVGAFDEAIDAYNKAIELDFRVGWLYSNLGFAYAHKGKFAEAIPVYEKSIELFNSDKDKAVSWSRLGEVYRQLNQYNHAFQAYQKAVELDPQDASFQASLSALQEQVSQPEQDASSDMEPLQDSSAVEEDMLPVDNKPQDDLPALDEAENDGIVAGAVSRLFAEEAIPGAIASAGDLVPTEEVSANLESVEGTAPGVMQIVGDAPSPDPDLRENVLPEPLVVETPVEENNPLPEMIEAVIEPSQPEEAALEKPSTESLLEQDELNITAVNSLLMSGIELWRKGEHQKAGEILQTALEAAGKAENKWLEALSHNALALVKTELGKLEEAIGSYIQAMQLAPEKIIPWNNIGHLYSKLDRNDEAKGAFLKAIEYNPEDFVGWDGLGDIYAKVGRVNDAIAAYQLANVFGKQKHPQDALIAYQMMIEPEIENILEKPANDPWIPEISPVAESEMGQELAQADMTFIPEESLAEAVSEILWPVAVDIVSSEEIETQDVAAQEIVPTLPKSTNEVILVENLSASDGPIQADETDAGTEIAPLTPEIADAPIALDAGPTSIVTLQPEEEPVQTGSIIAVAHIPEEALIAENIVSLPSDSKQAEQAADTDQPVEETQMPMPELAGGAILAEGDSAPNSLAEFESAIPTEEFLHADSVLETPAEQELVNNVPSGVELSRLASAIAAYKKVTEINPENDRAWDSLGNLYRASERHHDAIAAFEQAISLCPNKEVYHYHLGLVYAAEKHYEDAIGSFKKVIELNPDYTFAHCALAGYLRKLGRELEAQEHIERALPKMTSEKEYDRACFAAICGNTDEAIELLKIALEKKQTSLEWARRDPDLDFIREDERFKALLSHNGGWSERLPEIFSKQLAWSPDK